MTHRITCVCHYVNTFDPDQQADTSQCARAAMDVHIPGNLFHQDHLDVTVTIIIKS